jgi:hypothetical protein
MIQLPGYTRLQEPLLLFDALSQNSTSIHPLQGLCDFGPYSKSIIQQMHNPIRVAAIYPDGYYNSVVKLIQELKGTASPRERKSYLPEYVGFESIYKTGLKLVNEEVSVKIPLTVLDDRNGRPHIVLSEAIGNAVKTITQRRQDFDVLVVYLPEAWRNGYEVLEENFNLHDMIKAFTADVGLPTQIINERGATNYNCRCSVMWRLSIALYVKAGGVPWKLAYVDEDTLIVGLSYAMRYIEQTQSFEYITCCSQVFDSDGTGLEFIAYDTGEINSGTGGNPFLSRAEMRRVMLRSLSLYQKRHAGRSPKKVVVHKTTEFKRDEIDGCKDAFPLADQLELLQIKDNSLWRGINIPVNKQIGSYPLERGSFIELCNNEVLLWTQGVVQLNGKPFYKEGKSIPAPLCIVRHHGGGGWSQNCNIILGLTKMNWNHDGLYNRLPVTLGYASVLATTLKRMGSLSKRPYEFRFFM